MEAPSTTPSITVDQGPAKKQRTATPSVKEQCFTFWEEGWRLVTNLTPRQQLTLSEVKRPDIFVLSNYKQFVRWQGQSLSSLFLEFVPRAVWDLFVKVVNRELARNSTCNKQDSRRRLTNQVELIRWYGIQLAMENSASNENRNVRKHYAAMRARYGPFSRLGLDRFLALTSAFKPTAEEIQEICDLLRDTFMEHLNLMTVRNLNYLLMIY